MNSFLESFRAWLVIPFRGRRLSGLLFDSYRPELHYMRGPGPKWREKHARSAEFAS
jgi:hypothetical protein